jgi:hypothetical protein
MRNLNDIERVRRLVENLIHLLQRSVRGFWEKEVDAGDHGGVDYGENNVGLVTDVCKGNRGDHYDDEIENLQELVNDKVGSEVERLTQLAVVEIAFAGARIGRGVISAG